MALNLDGALGRERGAGRSLIVPAEPKKEVPKPTAPRPTAPEGKVPQVERDGSAGQIAATLVEIKAALEEQKKENEQLRKQIIDQCRQLERATRRIEKTTEFFAKERDEIDSEIRNVARSEIAAASMKAADAAKKEIQDVAKAARGHIEALDKESRERTMRLSKILVSEKAFKAFKWAAVVIVILVGMTALLQMWG